MSRLLAVALVAACSVSAQQRVAGRVFDALTGEALAKARIEAGSLVVSSDGDGQFVLDVELPAEFRISLVGYRTRIEQVADAATLEVFLESDNAAPTTLTVRESPFEASVASSVSERRLRPAELQNLAGVLMGDPLRAAQALPGITASNDFSSQFSARGAGFDRIGIYLDGVLLNSPQHSVRGQESNGSLTMINSDLIEELNVHLSAPPVAFMDRASSALDLRVREGSPKGLAFRFHAGVASSGVLANGPIGRKATWLAAFRKSYLQYLLRRASDDDTLAFGFIDAQAKLAYDPAPRHHFTLGFFDGKSDLDRSQARNNSGVNTVILADYHFSNLQLAHRYAASERFLVTNRFAWMRERSGQVNPGNLPLQGSYYGEWVGNSDAAWNWSQGAALRFGSSVRRIRDEGFLARYTFMPSALRRRDPWSGVAWRVGGYAEQSWFRGRSGLTAGVRIDDGFQRQSAAVSPHASLRVGLGAKTAWTAAFSHSVQYAPLSQTAVTTFGNPNLVPQRSIHWVSGLEQEVGSMTRLRVEAFYRADRDLIVQPLLEPRLLANGAIFNPPANPQFENSVRGSARGWEVFFQRRTANRWNGWVGYAMSWTRMRDGITNAHYDADWDQRHTVNGYASYRLTSTVNLSLRYSYGSNFPIPGFLRYQSGQYFLATDRNQLRLPAYHRSDLRLAKQFNRTRWRGILYVEAINLTNRTNRAFDSFNGYNSSGRASVSLVKLFPIVPAVGWQMDWDVRRS